MATTETIIFDATGSNIDGTDPGSALTVGWGTNYRLFEHEYPAPPQNVLYSSSIDTEGELPANSRYGNRTIRLKFKLVDSNGALRTALQAKYAKLQREGGTLKRTMANGDVRIYDILASDGWNPSYDFAYYIANLTIVEMTLQARPFSRGVEVDLGDNVETTLPVLIFTEASIPGDVDALGRLVIDEDGAQTQRTVLWGIQSRYYDSAAAAGLYFEAEACSSVFAVLTAGPAGASGSGNNTLKDSTLQTVSYEAGPQFDLTSRKHVGGFRVIVRAQAPVTNTGTVSARLKWIARSDPINYNVPVSIDPTTEGSWVLLDLGQINITPAKGGTHAVDMEVQAMSTVNGDDVYWDWIAFIPFLEGSGQANAGLAAATVLAPLPASGHLQIASDHVLAWDGTNRYGRTNSYEGSYLLVPPSGADNRTVRVFIKASRGRLLPTTLDSLADAGIDDISAKLFVTPRYLT